MTRTRVPTTTASKVLIANRHACCVCQDHPVQLHHIDENSSNNDPGNLAALCLRHHDQASMQIGLTKKLRADEVRHYKQQWEARCAADVEALSRDRLRFYGTVYKNPPRIRELFSRLTREERLSAASVLKSQIQDDIEQHKKDGGFAWQAVPGDNNLTQPLLMSLRAGELWPQVLPRVGGHPDDPDYPIDLGPPYGMTAFHGFDLYCQLMVRTLCIHRTPLALESIWSLDDAELIDQLAGSLVSFRERAIGKSIVGPRGADEHLLGRVQFRVKKGDRVYRAFMDIKNMYVFSDTAALNLERSKVCGVALLEDAQTVTAKGATEIHLGLKPLIIGIGGLGQSEAGFWDVRKGQVGSSKVGE